MAQTTETGHGMAASLAEQATEAAGMPQLDFSTFSNQIFWLVVALVAIYYILTRKALPRISTILADRQGTISGDIAAAEALRQRAVDAEEAYTKALADARAESARIAGEARAEIQVDLDKAIATADAQIAAKTAESEQRIAEIRAGALDSVEAVARDTAISLLAALGTEADEAKVAAAVGNQMKG